MYFESVMYVCLCNSLKDKEIARAIEGGASCVDDVYGCFGCKPQCGKCIPHIQEKLQGDSLKTTAIA